MKWNGKSGLLIIKTMKPIPKQKQKASYWRNKCDRLIQETGREIYSECMVCGGEYSCLHHFYPKSQTTYLRYNMKNLIPICAGCHLKHHNGDPEIHAVVIELKGSGWYAELKAERNKNRYVNAGYSYYRNKYEILLLLKPYKI